MYNDFDNESFPSPRTNPDDRSPFAIDRDRIIHSRAFCRLQAKTQVFSTGEYDFYRTRLTHSVEVGQIGRSICAFLAHEHPDGFKIDSDLVEAACLAHDLGNPPFGHSGERTLHKCMQPHGRFEGNAQTMRLLTKRMFTESSGRTGIKPTRALMDAVCKYKVHWSPDLDNHFLYTDQLECMNFIHGNNDCEDQSVECQVMDWADDIANGYADINDGVKARLITVAALEQWIKAQSLDNQETQHALQVSESIKNQGTEKFTARGIGECVRATKLIERTNIMSEMTKRYKFGIQVDKTVQKRCQMMKKIAKGIRDPIGSSSAA